MKRKEYQTGGGRGRSLPKPWRTPWLSLVRQDRTGYDATSISK